MQLSTREIALRAGEPTLLVVEGEKSFSCAYREPCAHTEVHLFGYVGDVNPLIICITADATA